MNSINSFSANRGNAKFDKGGTVLDGADVVGGGAGSAGKGAGRKKPSWAKIWIIVGAVVVAVGAIVAEILVLLPSFSNDVDLTQYWYDVVGDSVYFQDDVIYYEVGSGRGGNYRRVGDEGAIARMGLDGKNREVLVEASSRSVVILGVFDGELYYARRGASGNANEVLMAVGLDGDEHKERLVAGNVAEGVGEMRLKDGWGYYYDGLGMSRVELATGKNEELVRSDEVLSLDNEGEDIYYLEAGALWKVGVREAIWVSGGDDDAVGGSVVRDSGLAAGGLVVRDGLAYFMMFDRLVKVDVESGELVGEMILRSGAAWGEGAYYAADDERLVYGLPVQYVSGYGTGGRFVVVTVDMGSMSEVSMGALPSSVNFALSGEYMRLAQGRYAVMGALRRRTGDLVVVDVESGRYREIDQHSDACYSWDGYLYQVRSYVTNGVREVDGPKYGIEKMLPEDLFKNDSIKY